MKKSDIYEYILSFILISIMVIGCIQERKIQENTINTIEIEKSFLMDSIGDDFIAPDDLKNNF